MGPTPPPPTEGPPPKQPAAAGKCGSASAAGGPDPLCTMKRCRLSGEEGPMPGKVAEVGSVRGERRRTAGMPGEEEGTAPPEASPSSSESELEELEPDAAVVAVPAVADPPSLRGVSLLPVLASRPCSTMSSCTRSGMGEGQV